MCSRDDRLIRWATVRMAPWILLLLLIPGSAPAQEYSAAAPPRGRFLLRSFPKAFLTSAYFSDEGRALNLDTVTGLLYVELPVQVQYGLPWGFSLSGTLPLGWSYQEVVPEVRKDPVHRFAVREAWLMLQHRWWTLHFTSASLLRLKIPLAHKKYWEDGLRIGDGQVDLHPAYIFDYRSVTRYWLTELEIGYKYRFKGGDGQPQDELNLRSTLGFELWGRPRMDVFVFGDFTRFLNGDYGDRELRFFKRDGSLHTLGYGVALEPYPLGQGYVSTAGDFSGRNRYRGMRWTLGFRRACGHGGEAGAGCP